MAQQFVQLVTVLKGDTADGPMQQPLLRLATIVLGDLEALWADLGVVEFDWTVSPEAREASSPYLQLHSIQSFTAYEHECSYSEVSAFLQECKRAQYTALSEAGGRALSVLTTIANRQRTLGTGLSFRAGVIWWPPETSVEPGLP